MTTVAIASGRVGGGGGSSTTAGQLLAPSGDTTGVIDLAAITAALTTVSGASYIAGPRTVILAPGTWYISAAGATPILTIPTGVTVTAYGATINIVGGAGVKSIIAVPVTSPRLAWRGGTFSAVGSTLTSGSYLFDNSQGPGFTGSFVTDPTGVTLTDWALQLDDITVDGANVLDAIYCNNAWAPQRFTNITVNRPNTTGITASAVSILGGTIVPTVSTIVERCRVYGAPVAFSVTAGGVLRNSHADAWEQFGTIALPAVVSCVRTAPARTITFASAPTLVVGQRITLSGATPAYWNGTYEVTSVSGSVITIFGGQNPTGNATVQPTALAAASPATTSQAGVINAYLVDTVTCNGGSFTNLVTGDKIRLRNTYMTLGSGIAVGLGSDAGLKTTVRDMKIAGPIQLTCPAGGSTRSLIQYNGAGTGLWITLDDIDCTGVTAITGTGGSQQQIITIVGSALAGQTWHNVRATAYGTSDYHFGSVSTGPAIMEHCTFFIGSGSSATEVLAFNGGGNGTLRLTDVDVKGLSGAGCGSILTIVNTSGGGRSTINRLTANLVQQKGIDIATSDVQVSACRLTADGNNTGQAIITTEATVTKVRIWDTEYDTLGGAGNFANSAALGGVLNDLTGGTYPNGILGAASR